MKFEDGKLIRDTGSKVYSIRLPYDLRDRLEKIRPDEISLGECIRQILENYVGIERPLSKIKVNITPEEMRVRDIFKSGDLLKNVENGADK